MAKSKSALAKGFSRPAKRDTPPAKPESKLRRAELGERVAVYVPEELAKALRMKCAAERRSVSDAATEALRVWLGL